MGKTISKPEKLYRAVVNGHHSKVDELSKEGTSLEWADKKGRTALILACSKRSLFDMVERLLDCGANMNAYVTGKNGGFPLHYAARGGVESTLDCLIAHGADPTSTNDEKETPLEIARRRGHVGIVRKLEEHLSLFQDFVRRVRGPKLLKYIAPEVAEKKKWVAVLPSTKNIGLDLFIYKSPKDSVPQTTILLLNATITLENQYLHISIIPMRKNYKFKPLNEGDSDQIEIFYNACKGIRAQEPDENVQLGGTQEVPNNDPSASTSSEPCNSNPSMENNYTAQNMVTNLRTPYPYSYTPPSAPVLPTAVNSGNDQAESFTPPTRNPMLAT